MTEVLQPTPRMSHLGTLELERSDQSVYDPTHDFQGKEVWRTGSFDQHREKICHQGYLPGPTQTN